MCTMSSLRREGSEGNPFKRLLGHLQSLALLPRLSPFYQCHGRLAAPPIEINRHMRAGRPPPRACQEGPLPQPAVLRTVAVEAPCTSKAAQRVTVFNEEVPQIGSGQPVGAGQAARRIPECHHCQASEPVM